MNKMQKNSILKILLTLLVTCFLFAACSSQRAAVSVNNTVHDQTTIQPSNEATGSSDFYTPSPNDTGILNYHTDLPNNTEVPSKETERPEETSLPSNNAGNPTDRATPKPQETQPVSLISLDLDGVNTLNELEDQIEEYIKQSISSLNNRWNALMAKTDTYEKYCQNAKDISAFYNTIVSETNQMCIILREYSAVYARMVLDSTLSSEKKYKAIDGINDCLYDDACNAIYKKIYDGILDDMEEYYYNGVLEDAEEKVDYSDWYDVCSKEYSQWYDASSEVYSLYYETSSNIYSFYYDLSGKVFNEDFDRAEKIYERFLKKLAKEKGIDIGDKNPNVKFDTTLRNANSTGELEELIIEHVSECIQALEAEWQTISSEINTFEKYQENNKIIKEFHKHIEEASYQLFVMLYDYGAYYADFIMQSNSSSKDKYSYFEDLKECIYEDACDLIKDDIYDGILKDINDYYYNGLIKDARDTVPYSDWSDARSDTYGWWSDARSEVYGDWSDARGTLYKFISNIRSELYSGNIDEANEELSDFKEKIAKAKGIDTGDTNPNAVFDTSLRSINNENEFKTVVKGHVSECVQALEAEWKALSADIDTFDKFMNNSQKIKDFHKKTEESAHLLLVMICDYGIRYAEMIMQSDSLTKEKYQSFDGFRKCIYEDACEIVKEDIYEGLLKDIKAYYYDGIINDAKGDVQYSDWSDARGDAYSWWSDARGEVYSDWSDTRGNIYSFFSGIRSELYSGDITEANEELEDFKKEVNRFR